MPSKYAALTKSGDCGRFWATGGKWLTSRFRSRIRKNSVLRVMAEFLRIQLRVSHFRPAALHYWRRLYIPGNLSVCGDALPKSTPRGRTRRRQYRIRWAIRDRSVSS